MEQKGNDGGYAHYYLCRGRRYKLPWIDTIDNEEILLRTPHAFRDISLFTESYQYKFQREKDDRNRDYAIFKERVKMNDSYLNWIKSIESPVHHGVRNYIYTEEDGYGEIGDFPRYEELIKRIRERKEFIENEAKKLGQ